MCPLHHPAPRLRLTNPCYSTEQSPTVLAPVDDGWDDANSYLNSLGLYVFALGDIKSCMHSAKRSKWDGSNQSHDKSVGNEEPSFGRLLPNVR